MADRPPTITVITKRAFPFLWCRSLTGASLANGACCAKCLRGPYLTFIPFGRRAVGRPLSGPLDEHGGQLWYLCGVLGGAGNWHRNTHLLLHPAAGSRFTLEDETIRVEVIGADPLSIRPLPPEAAASLTTRQARCRCVWVGYSYFAQGQPIDMGSNI